MAVQQQISDDYLLDLLSDERSVEKGFRLLMHKYQERLYWQIYKILPEHEDVNDVLQNCFIKVYRNVQSFQGKSQLYTWLYRIATNEAITFLNKQKKIKGIPLEDVEENLHLQQAVPFDRTLQRFCYKMELNYLNSVIAIAPNTEKCTCLKNLAEQLLCPQR